MGARANEDELLPGRKVSQKLDLLKSILISKATGREANDDTYKNLREELLTIPEIQDELPEFLFHIENLTDFGILFNHNLAPIKVGVNIYMMLFHLF